MSASVERVYYIEELAANAWPAEVVQVVDGWRFRYSPGITSRRVNSVWPNNKGRFLGLDEKLTMVEAFYARRNLPARFQMCPAAQPPELDRILAARGYTLEAPTLVQSTTISAVLGAWPREGRPTVILHPQPPPAFIDFQAAQYRLSREQTAARRTAFQRIGPQAAFAVVERDGKTIGVGLGIVERGWLGIFGMMTHPDFRRRGIATAVLQALAEWGQSHGAEQTYLQVMAENGSARNLYQQAGFGTQYQYYYRQSL